MPHLNTSRLLLLRTRFLLFTITPALLPLGALAFYAWLPEALLKYFFFTKGWIAWTFTEYCIHRWLMHGGGNKENRQPDRFNHLHHHTHPHDMRITPLMRSMTFPVFIVACWSMWQGPVLLTYVTGWLCGLSLYTVMHYLLHQPYACRWFPRLVRQHIWHHGKYPKRCFGVTTTFWDRAFKTTAPADRALSDNLIRYFYAGRVLPAGTMDELIRILQGKRKHAEEKLMIRNMV